MSDFDFFLSKVAAAEKIDLGFIDMKFLGSRQGFDTQLDRLKICVT